MSEPTRRIRASWVAAGLLIALAPAHATAQTSPRCTDAEFRQMDFWLGSWEVTDAEGTVVGRSTVSPIMEMCARREEWDSGQVKGMSINMYDKPTRSWHQMWVDNMGVVLRLEGARFGEGMMLHGSRVGSDGKERQLRVSLTPQADGSLRQLQERSEDGGMSWSVIFDGHYRKTGI